MTHQFTVLRVLFALFLCLCFVPSKTQAQNQDRIEEFSTKVEVLRADQLLASRFNIVLWGIEAAQTNDSVLLLKAKKSMEALIADNPVRCQVKFWQKQNPVAQCMTMSGIDIGFAMVEGGFATIDPLQVRTAKEGTRYFAAQKSAEAQLKGIWRKVEEYTDQEQASSNNLIQYVRDHIFLLATQVAAFLLLLFLIIIGFVRSKQTMKQAIAKIEQREDAMRQREKFVLAAMLEAELQANKGKIEAFIVINQDMLNSINDAQKKNRLHKFQESAEIFQKNPALDRTVFDAHNGRMELLGEKLAQAIVSVYGKIKIEADYVTLDKSKTMNEAMGEIQASITRANSLLPLLKRALSGLQVVMNDRRTKEREATYMTIE